MQEDRSPNVPQSPETQSARVGEELTGTQEDRSSNVPQSPETQSADVREELHQENVTHQGQPRSAEDAGPTPSSHFGAVEDDRAGHVDQTPVTPPMEGPYDLIDEDTNKQDIDVDPHREIPGGG